MDKFVYGYKRNSDNNNADAPTSKKNYGNTTPKTRTYDSSYLSLGFTSAIIDGMEKPMCLFCTKVLAADSMRPGKLKRHLETMHSEYYISENLQKMISLDSLDSLKLFAVDPKQRSMLLQDKTLIDGLVLLLSNDSETVIISTLEIFLLLLECPEGKTLLNDNNYLEMQLQETLQSPNEDICSKSMKLQETLQNTPVNSVKTNIYQTPKNNRRNNLPKDDDQPASSRNSKYKTILFQLKGLFDKHDRELCTCLLVKVKGVVSIIFDMNKSRCTVRVLSKVQPEVLAEEIAKSQTMSAQQIVKNEFGEEVILPSSSDQVNVSTEGPEYLDDIESPQPDDKAVCRNGSSNNRFYSGSWLRTAANYFSNSLWL